jgi:hypothetical protein
VGETHDQRESSGIAEALQLLEHAEALELAGDLLVEPISRDHHQQAIEPLMPFSASIVSVFPVLSA